MQRDFQALEKRRLAAVKLFSKELNNSEISRLLQVCNQTVCRWRKQYAAGGKSALEKVGRAGRKPLVGGDDQQRLVELLQQGPERWALRQGTPFYASSGGVQGWDPEQSVSTLKRPTSERSSRYGLYFSHLIKKGRVRRFIWVVWGF